MCAARLNYIAPWWTYWLHNFPHTNLRLKPVESAFRPQEEDYQQSLIFLGCVAAAALGLNLLFLATYLSCLCCCHKEDESEEENKRSNSCCVSWTAVLAALVIWIFFNITPLIQHAALKSSCTPSSLFLSFFLWLAFHSLPAPAAKGGQHPQGPGSSHLVSLTNTQTLTAAETQ